MHAEDQKNKKIILSILIPVVALMIFALVAFIINLQKSATLHVIVAPSFAEIKFNGKTIKNDSDLQYYPGDYAVTISAEGFIPQEITVSLQSGEDNYLYTYLLPTSDNADYYIDHPDEDAVMQRAVEAQAELDKTMWSAKYPVVNILPYIATSDRSGYDRIIYRIDYGKWDNCENDFCIKITDNTCTNHVAALDYIKSNGYNPDDYEILYDCTLSQEAQELLPDYPIVADLPIVVEEYSDDYSGYIHYTVNYKFDDQKFSLVIEDSLGNAKMEAIDKIKELSPVAAGYNIIYIDNSNNFIPSKAPNDYVVLQLM